MSDLENFDVYANPDDQGPLSEVSDEEAQADYQEAKSNWEAMSPAEQERITQVLREAGVDVSALGQPPGE